MKTTAALFISLLLAACSATRAHPPSRFSEDPVRRFLEHRDELINDDQMDEAMKLFAPDTKIAVNFDYVSYGPHNVLPAEFFEMFASRSEEKRCGRKVFVNIRTSPTHIEIGKNRTKAACSIVITSRTVLTRRILKQNLTETVEVDFSGKIPVIRSDRILVGSESIEPDQRTKTIFAIVNSRAGMDEAEAIRLLEEAGFKYKVRTYDGSISIMPDSRSDALDQYGDEIPALASQIPGLKELVIWTCGFGHVTDDGLKFIAGMGSLQELAVCSTEITGRGIENLASLPDLRSLALCGTYLTDEDSDSLTRLKKLTLLKIVGGKITDKGLACFPDLVNLENLALSNMNITDEGMVYIARLQNLHSLKLISPDITDTGLVHLEALKKLRILDIRGTRTTPSGVQKLKQTNPGLNVRR